MADDRTDLFLGALSAPIVLWLAPRKGCFRWYAVPAFIPCFGFFIVLYVLSLTDKKVLDDIEVMKKRIGTGGEGNNPNA